MMKVNIIWVLVFGLHFVALSQNAVTIESVKLNATFQHISCHIDISGDINNNSSFEILYKQETAENYKQGAETMRATPSMIVDGSSLNMNFHAGSAMFLEVNTIYDIRLVITDPDGGSTTFDRKISTKSYPVLPLQGTIISVTSADGPQAIQTAINSASEGDIIEVSNGTYSPFSIGNDSIYIVSKKLHRPVIDGGNTDRGVITVGVFDDSIRHVYIDGFVIQNGRWGVDAQNTQFFTLQNCAIKDVDYGIVNRRARGWEHDLYITNNLFEGRTTWPQNNGNIPGERAVDIRGNNNVVSYNSISNFGDGVTTDGPLYKISYSLDIHHNDIFRIVDDLIEVDGMVSNSRVYSNRAYNGRAGVSLAPVYGGPAYVFRNQFVNMENSTYKMNRKPAGLYIVHNTTIQEGDGMSSDAGWQNTVMKNNLVYAGFYCFQEYGLVSGSMDDWDYNGYYSARAGTSGTPWFKWANVRYAKVPELITGTNIETNAIEISLADLVSVTLPSNPFVEVDPSSLDLNPSAGTGLLDAGQTLSNINVPYVLDGMPDLGAFELGMPAETYGHNFENTCGTSALVRTWNGSASQSWTDRKNWSPCGIPTLETEVIIPQGLIRYPILGQSSLIKNLEIGN